MRVTNMYMVDMAQQANAKNQSTVAQLSQEVSSGLAVAKPSDDPVKWMEAQREKVRSAINDGTGEALQSGIAKLTATDGALSSLSGLLAQAQSLAVEGASANITSDARANEAQQVNGLLQSVLAAANTKDVDGTYLLSGTLVATQPYEPTGNYQGNGASISINSSASDTSQATISGSSLQLMVETIGNLGTALTNNDTTGIQTALGNLNTAVSQMSTTRAQVGGMMASLQSAQSAQQSLQTSLASSISNYTEVDAVQSASSLAQASTVLQVSQSVTQKVLELLTPPATT